MLHPYRHPKKMKKEDVKSWLIVAAFFTAMAIVAVAAKMFMPVTY